VEREERALGCLSLISGLIVFYKGAACLKCLPEPFIYTVYDLIFVDFSARNTVYKP
jgi:hypothetical protein